LDEKKTKCYELRNSCVLGRNNNGYFTITSELDSAYKHCTTVRNPYVGKEHATIEVKDITELVKIGKEEIIIQKKRCTIEDCLSKNGTAINGDLLGPKQERELKNGDKISLAPSSLKPLDLQFKYPV
jgi:pSer/pThr/pTyr-binding forkhead associated (FHA) protein